MKDQKNYLKIGSDADYRELMFSENKFTEQRKVFSPIDLRKEIEPWLTALFQSERLNLLVGSGLTISQKSLANGDHTQFMRSPNFDVFSNQIKKSAKKKAKQNGRKAPNIEDTNEQI